MSLGLLPTPTVTICKVAKMVFNVAPGNFYLSQYLEYQEANGTSATVEALAGLAGGTDAAFVTTVLTNLGLADDAGASAFLTSAVAANGRGAALEAAIDALNAIPAGDATYGAAKTAFDEATVTSVSFSTNAANNSTDSAVLAAAISSEAVATGQSYNLTTAVDMLVGTSADDTFMGDNSGASASDTLSAADQVNGGEGSDTLKLFGTANTLPVTMASIENLYLNNPGDATQLDLSSFTDITSVELDAVELSAAANNAAVEKLTLAQGQALTLDSVKDNTGGTHGIDIAGAMTSLDLTLDGAGNTASGGNDIEIDLDGADDLATLNITASGAASNVSITDADNAVTTINVSGDKAVTLGTLTTKVATFNASNMTAGGVTVDFGVSNGATTITGSAAGDDITADAAVAYTVDLGAGDDRVTIAGNLGTTDTFNGGEGTDTVEVTGALTNALVARLSNFEIIDIGGSDNVTHDVGDATWATILEVDGAATGAGGDVIITDLVETASVRINAALGDGLVVNQANSTTGSPNDSMTVIISEKTAVTTGQEIEIDAIETLNFEISSSGSSITHTVSDLQADAAHTININASTATAAITATDTAAVVLIDASASAKAVQFTTDDTFNTSFLFKGGAGKDVFTSEGATLVAGTIIEVGNGLDTVTLDSANNVAIDIKSTATTAAGAVAITDDSGTANTAAFVSGTTDFDYNGGVNNGSNTTIVESYAATATAALAADTDATVIGVTTAAGDATLEAALTAYVATQNATNADAVEAAAITVLGSIASLDTYVTADEAILFAIDVETNDAGGDNDGGSVILRFVNSTATGNEITAGEIELIAVVEDAALAAGDII